jgi:hypothetical protein
LVAWTPGEHRSRHAQHPRQLRAPKRSTRVNATFKFGCFGINVSVVQSVIDQALGLFQTHTGCQWQGDR